MAATGSQFIKSMLKFSVGSWVSAGIAFISVPIVTRFFSPEEFGKINMFVMAVGLIAAVVGLSMEQSYVRFFKEAPTDCTRKKILTQCIAVVVIMSCIYFIANAIFGKLISFKLFGEFNPWLIYLAMPLMVVLTIVMSYQSLFFRMSEKAFGFAILAIFIVLANKVAMVGAAFYDPTYSVGLYFVVGASLLVVISCLILQPKSFEIFIPKIKKVEVRPLLKYALPLLPVGFIVSLNTFVIRYMLKDYVSYNELGVFVAALSIANVITLIQTGFNTYWTPFMFANYKTEQALIKKIHSVITFLLVGVALIIILFSDPLFLLLGNNYREGKEIFGFLLVSPITYTISETTSYGINISKKTQKQTYSVIVSFLVSISVAYLLIPTAGILGAALANACGGIVYLGVRTYFGQKEYISVEKAWRTIVSILVLFAVACIYYCISSNQMRPILVLLLLLSLCIIYRDIITNARYFIEGIRKKN